MCDPIKVIVAAAGKGTRMGAQTQINKPYLLLQGKPIICYSLDFFESLPQVDEIVVVAAQSELDYCQEHIIQRYGYQKIKTVLPGGKERQQSIKIGLDYLKQNGAEWVAVHDGARPFLHRDLFEDLCREVIKWRAVVPGVLLKDTVKQVDSRGWVIGTPPRSTLRAIQTPQVFCFDSLYQAYQRAEEEGYQGTDDAMLFEKYSGRVRVWNTDWNNIKITTPVDLQWATFLVKSMERENDADWNRL